MRKRYRRRRHSNVEKVLGVLLMVVALAGVMMTATMLDQGAGVGSGGKETAHYVADPEDYTDKPGEVTEQETAPDVSAVESAAVPAYWQTALDNGAQEINTALSEAGQNKSAFCSIPTCIGIMAVRCLLPC